ncbi:MAG: arylsulfatase [Candidatus Hydrogenedentes bacterium]|nr:arylsulfatase [Candidatus Hydrogenedentota bacterium]
MASTLGSCATSARPGPAAAGPGPRKPNIIFILTDDLGYGDLGCYGQAQIETPCLDAMAAEGVRFTQCYAGSTVCAPSRCCLMTGLHTGHALVRGNARVPLRPDDVTVAEILKAAGYTTGLVGKWGLGEPDTTGVPNRQGFDYFFGYLNQGRAHNYYPDYLWRNEERIELEGNVEDKDRPRVSIERTQYSHDLFTQEALAFVERHQAEPFFLYLAYTIPHANNERGRVDGDGMEVPDYGAYAGRDWPNPQKGHAAMIARMDRDVGRLFERLRALGLDDDTIVFFTSDNGPHKEGGADPAFFQSAGPLRGYKRDLYEGGIRVPGMVRWPGRIAPGALSDHVWAFWDFLPTAAELAGVDAPAGLDGISFVPALLGEAAAGRPQENHDFLYWEFHEGPASKQAARTGDWKGVRLQPDRPLELYNMAADVGEKNDIAGNHPDVVARIEAYLATARTESADWPLRRPKTKKK